MGHNDHIEDRFDTVDSFVCAECVIDNVLAGLVSNNLSSRLCSYCGTRSELPNSAPFEVIIERIYESICMYYADAQDIDIPWDSGWILPEKEPYDVLDTVNPGWDDKFTNDILECLGYDKYWVPHSQGDWLLSNSSEVFISSWNAFTETVLYKTRYLFLSETPDEVDPGRLDYIPVKYVLEAIGNLVKRLNIFKELKQGEKLYRVRVAKDGESFSEFKEVSVPPKEGASGGRMNPAGIPYLYVALDEETAIQEILNQKRPYALAELMTNKPLKLIDLSELPAASSFFEPEKYTERHEILFLQTFRDEISKPISKDRKEHLAYIPTQILSEYFRYRFTVDDERIDGVIYKSSKSPNGKNIAFFVSEHKHVERIISLSSLCMREVNIA